MIIIAIALGVLSWSLAEYCIHRWLGHRHTNNLFGLEHTRHHSRGDYFAPSWKKGVAALLAAAVLIGPALLVAPTHLAIAYVCGFAGFYLSYEALHRLEHVWQGIGPYARWARRHHFHHHFHDPSKNHGVTSPLWDVVFKTYARPGVIRVPEKLQMRWLCDAQTGDVHAHLQPQYQLRKRKST